MELHVKSSLDAGVAKVHLHWMFDSLGRPVRMAAKKGLCFMGSHPHFSEEVPKARGRACKRAFDQGHFYLYVDKIGSIFRSSTDPAFTAFPVSPDWITQYWSTCKITDATARAAYIQAKKHVKQYLVACLAVWLSWVLGGDSTRVGSGREMSCHIEEGRAGSGRVMQNWVGSVG